jgi:hypothetical protein
MIAFNTHPDVGPPTASSTAFLASHEIAHHVSLLATKKGAASNPFEAVAEALSLEKDMYAFIIKNFGETVYRSLMSERIAYSFCEKYTRGLKDYFLHPAVHRMHAGPTPKSEASILLEDLKEMSSSFAARIAPYIARAHSTPAIFSTPQATPRVA